MIIRRYLNREVLSSTVAILGVLFAIFMSQRVVKYLGQAAEGDISGLMVWQMVGLYSPVLIGFLLPLAFFLGCLLSFSRLYVDSEIAVLRSVGVSEKGLIKMLLPLALCVGVFGGAIALFIAPWATESSSEVRDEHASKLELSMLSPGQFQVFQDGQGVVYAESTDESQRLGKFFLAELEEGGSGKGRLISAQSAERYFDEAQNKNFLQLNNGYLYQLDQEQRVVSVTEFEHYYARLDAVKEIVSRRKISSMSTMALFNNIMNGHSEAQSPLGITKKVGVAASWAELHWRLAVPLSVPFLLFLAIPLSRVRPREGKFAKMVPALLVYIGYIVLMVILRRWIEDEKLPGVIGYLPIYAIMGALGFRMLTLHSRSNTKLNKTQQNGSTSESNS